MMSQRLDEYFADEAGEYLDQLHELLNDSSGPDAEGILRLAIGVRGSTRMAGADPISRLAGRLEDAARSIADQQLRWEDDVRDVARSTVTEIRDLVGSIATWGPAEDQRVERCLHLWKEVSAAAVEVVSIESLFFDDDGPHVIEGAALAIETPLPVVAIDTLLFRGEVAIREARSLRATFENAARGDIPDGRSLPDLVDELFDLLDLGSSADMPEA